MVVHKKIHTKTTWNSILLMMEHDTMSEDIPHRLQYHIISHPKVSFITYTSYNHVI